MHFPPLNSLRVFEAVGRLSSFKKAAAELHVTAGAVSKQIKLLEDHLGFSLFERRSSSTVLTNAGKQYLNKISPALHAIADATMQSRKQDEDKPLKIWCSPFVMQRWLMPRLKEFRTRIPDQNIIIEPIAGEDRSPADGDIGIQRGNGRRAGYRARLLFPIRLVPVCSPTYLAGRPAPRCFGEMVGHSILENLARPDEWPTWSQSAGGQGLPEGATISLNSSDAVFQAAIDGMGIAIGRTGFIERHLANGSLVQASDHVAETGDGYYLVVPSDRPMPRRALTFQRWLLRELR